MYGLLSWDPLRWISFFIAWLRETTDHCSRKQTCQSKHLWDCPCAFPTGIGLSCWWMWRACQKKKKKKSWSHKRLTVLNLQVLHCSSSGIPSFHTCHTQHDTMLSPRVINMIQVAVRKTTCLKPVWLLKRAWGEQGVWFSSLGMFVSSLFYTVFSYLIKVLLDGFHFAISMQVFNWVSVHGWKRDWSYVLFPLESKKNLWPCKCAMADPTSSSTLR